MYWGHTVNCHQLTVCSFLAGQGFSSFGLKSAHHQMASTSSVGFSHIPHSSTLSTVFWWRHVRTSNKSTLIVASKRVCWRDKSSRSTFYDDTITVPTIYDITEYLTRHHGECWRFTRSRSAVCDVTASVLTFYEIAEYFAWRHNECSDVLRDCGVPYITSRRMWRRHCDATVERRV